MKWQADKQTRKPFQKPGSSYRTSDYNLKNKHDRDQTLLAFFFRELARIEFTSEKSSNQEQIQNRNSLGSKPAVQT